MHRAQPVPGPWWLSSPLPGSSTMLSSMQVRRALPSADQADLLLSAVASWHSV